MQCEIYVVIALCFTVQAGMYCSRHILLFQGCTAIGYAGSYDKVEWLKKELGFDFAFNYKKVNLSESLKEAAPEGVDVYFDGVSSKY